MYQIQGPPVLTNLQKLKDSGGILNNNKNKKQKRNKSQKQKIAAAQKVITLPKKPTTNRKGMIVTDREGTPITVFDGASYALSELNQWKKKKTDTSSMDTDVTTTSSNTFHRSQIQIAVASCTDKPTFARQCMDWLIVDDGSTLSSCFDHIEIRPGDKKKHFESLHRITNIPYEEMCFFDDYMLNIDSVSSLGVTCIHTPNGMTKDAWDEALSLFDLN